MECRYGPVGVSPSRLSRREHEVLFLAAKGWTNDHIGNHIGTTGKTVKCHMEHILLKLAAQNRAQAVAIGITRGLISYEDAPQA